MMWPSECCDALEQILFISRTKSLSLSRKRKKKENLYSTIACVTGTVRCHGFLSVEGSKGSLTYVPDSI